MRAPLLRRALALALVCAVMGGLFFYLLQAGTGRPLPPSLAFTDREPTDIAELQVENARGGYVIRYQEDLGGYTLGDVPPDLIDMERFISLMVAQGRLTAKTAVTPPLAPLTDYGLAQPLARCRIRFKDGSTLSYALGRQEPLSGDYYLQVSGREGVYTYGEQDALPLFMDAAAFISLTVTPPLTLTSPLSQVKDALFTGKQLTEPVAIHAVLGADEAIRRDALTFGAATHLIKGRGIHQLDQAGGIRVLGSLLGIRAIAVMGYNLDEAEIRSYGLHDPDMQVAFTQSRSREEVPVVLSIREAGGDTFYAHLQGRSLVYLINRPAFYDLAYEDLILRYFASPMLVDIQGFSVSAGDQRYDFTFTRNEAREATALVNGQAVDVELFYAFYRLITSAASDGGVIRGPEPVGQPLLEITYRYKNEQKQQDVLRFYPHAPRRLAVSVNGVTELDIREGFVQALLKACENLQKGRPIEEVW